MSLSGNQKALMYALGAVARGGATRGGYHSMLPYVVIGGALAPRVLVADLSVRDLLDESANTCQLTVIGATAPAPGTSLVITLGSINSGTRLFGGTILSEEQGYYAQKPSNPANAYHRLNGIDYTWLLGQHLVIKQYTNQTVAVIAADLLASFAEGMTANHIAADAGAIVIDTISFTNVTLPNALSQLCSRAGAYWYLDYFRDLHLFEVEPTTVYPDPTPLTPTHPSLANVTINQDLSQIVTRVFVEGGGGNALVDLPPGETILPLDTIGWYQPGGGQVTAGAQRLTYAGLSGGSGGVGSLVGPGVMPTTALTLNAADGAGIAPGLHDYAVTFVTAGGESMSGPRTTLNLTGLLARPGLPPVCSLNPGGTGPDPGVHDYAVTFLSATGETTPSVTAMYTQASIAAPTVAITIADSFDGSGYTVPGLKVGDQILLFCTYTADATDRVAPFPAAGETTWGPPSALYTVKQAPGRTGFMNFLSVVPFSGDPNVKFIHIWMSVNGAPSFYVSVASGGKANIINNPAFASTQFNFPQTLFYTSQIVPSVFNPILGGVIVSAIPTGDVGVTGRKLYRSAANTTQLRLLATLNDNGTRTYLDLLPDTSLGANVPTVGTALAAQVAISGIPIGPATVTGRRVYRTAAGGSQLKLVGTIADNTTPTYRDALADASLGANAPTGDTSGLQQPSGTVLAGSPTLLLAGISLAFNAGGGWAIIGNGQVIVRYTGISGNSLVGIPPSGVGSITTTIAYGAVCTAAAQLLGLPASGPGAIVFPIHNGDPVNLLVTGDDLNAQAQLQALIGGTGIVEDYIQDGRIGYTEAVARGTAMLKERSQLLVEVHYSCRDPLTRSGAMIHCALPPPTNLGGDYKIQDVTIANFSAKPGQPPTYTVQASSQRYSLDDLLRIARGTIGA